MASSDRCLYEVLGLTKNSSPDEIRSAYKRLALQRHPDKLVQSGLTHDQATAQFQELSHAYNVLSDPKERAWYDSHRTQILFSDFNSFLNSVPNLFFHFSNSAFPAFSGYSDSGNGFYKVYSDFFDKIHKNEINFIKKLGLGLDTLRKAPKMGNLQSPVKEVREFYKYWNGFSTVMDFRWEEGQTTAEREELKAEYNERVREMAEFVRKRDKRVIDLLRMVNEHRKRIERARREAEELETEKQRKEYFCELCGVKVQREKREQWRRRVQDVAEFGRSFAEEDAEEREDQCWRCIQMTSAGNSSV